MKTEMSWINFIRYAEKEFRYCGYSFDIDKAMDSKELNRIYDRHKNPAACVLALQDDLIAQEECGISFRCGLTFYEKMLILLEYSFFHDSFKRLPMTEENAKMMKEYRLWLMRETVVGFQWDMSKELFEISPFEVVPCDNDTNLHFIRRKENK